MNSEKKYLIVKGSGGGGLGDRIRSVLTGIVYAKLTNRTIYIDWRDGKLIPQRRNIFYDYFQLKNIDYVSNCPVSADVFPACWQGRLDASLHEQYQASGMASWDRQAAIKQFSFDQNRLAYAEEVLVMWEFDQLNDFSHHYSKSCGISLMKNVAAEHLAVSDPIREKIQDYRRQTFSDDEAIIAVHIRATNEFIQQKNTVKLQQYISQIKHCLRTLDDKSHGRKVKLFLATDNADVEDKLHSYFPGQLETREKWFATPGEKIHFNNQCPDAEKSLEDAIVEICLLAKSDYLIYQYNSSFGMIAHYLTKSDQNDIFPLTPASGILTRVKSRLNQLIR